MITETIHSEQFIALEKGFLHWMETLGYSPATVSHPQKKHPGVFVVPGAM